MGKNKDKKQQAQQGQNQLPEKWEPIYSTVAVHAEKPEIYDSIYTLLIDVNSGRTRLQTQLIPPRRNADGTVTPQFLEESKKLVAEADAKRKELQEAQQRMREQAEKEMNALKADADKIEAEWLANPNLLEAQGLPKAPTEEMPKEAWEAKVKTAALRKAYGNKMAAAQKAQEESVDKANEQAAQTH